MAAKQASQTILRQVKPILSVDKGEAKKRMLNLYKAWYRQIPYIGNLSFLTHNLLVFIVAYFLVMDYDIPKSADNCRDVLREQFMRNAHVTDIRVIDMLIIKVSCVMDL